MKYAFVFLSIIAVWVAVIFLASISQLNGMFLVIMALFMSMALYFIGFRKR
jgi:hypothetical protein